MDHIQYGHMAVAAVPEMGSPTFLMLLGIGSLWMFTRKQAAKASHQASTRRKTAANPAQKA